MRANFEPVFNRLRAILQRNAGSMKVADDTAVRYCLKCGLHPRHKTPMPVAWVQTGKNYVSYHLMPVYACPKLVEGCSKELQARMQGKSCFNFKTIDETLLQELEQLTIAAFAAWKKAGFGVE